MASLVLRFALLLLMSLLVGTMFGIWIGVDPSGLSAATYIEEQQNLIRSLNTLLPALGAAAIVLTATLAFLAGRDRSSRYLLIAAAACLIVAGLVTRLENQPINAIVMTWSAAAPAADWMQLRDAWWHWHIVRTIAAIAALSLLLFDALGARRPRFNAR